MVIAIGRIVKENSLIGIRIFDTDTKETKDIRIKDKDKIKIKNLKSLNKLGIVDNKQEDKPIIVIGEKDSKYLTVDINGNTKILNSLEGYNTIDLLTNIEQYEKYQARQSLVGNIFEFEIKEETDEVLLVKYNPSSIDYEVIEIPSFVTGIKKNNYGHAIGIFNGVTQSLKVIHRHNQIKDMTKLFVGFKGEKLDIVNFDTSKVKDMDGMFLGCENLKELDLRNFDTSNVEIMCYMFYGCEYLKELDLSNFDTSNVTDMCYMFCECRNLEVLDLSNFDTSKVEDMSRMFKECNSIKQIDLSNFDTSKVKNVYAMFSGCSSLDELDISKLELYIDDTSYMFYNCSSLKWLDLSCLKNRENIRNLKSMFEGCSSMKYVNLYGIDFEYEDVECVEDIFVGTTLTDANTNLSVGAKYWNVAIDDWLDYYDEGYEEFYDVNNEVDNPGDEYDKQIKLYGSMDKDGVLSIDDSKMYIKDGKLIEETNKK